MSRTLEDTLTPELFEFLLPEQRDNIQDSLTLLDHFAHPHSHSQENLLELEDYAFVVFPTARAYEGFLKLFFRHLGVLQEEHYQSRNFRVGRSFNPDIKMHLRDNVWIYDDVARATSDEIARRLWQMWLSGRNHLFHFFPDERYQVNYGEAKDLVEGLIQVMEDAFHSSER